MIDGGSSRTRNPARPHVAILLSVHNGETWLNAQLDSFLAQTHQHWTLYWRDDGSSDSSVAILHSFAEHRGHGRCLEVEESGLPLGVSLSYALLTECVPDGSVLSFADQDDVWHPEKLAWGLEKLAASAADGPALYCARQYLTDAALTVVGMSPLVRRPPDFASSLIQNVATGHTILLNPAAVRLMRDRPAPDGILHDWWAFMVVMGAGGALIYDPRCVSWYRQHGRNAVGAKSSFVRRGVAALRRGAGRYVRHLDIGVRALRERPETLTPSAMVLLDMLHAARSRSERLYVLWRHPELRRQTRVETLVFQLWYLSVPRRSGN